MGRRKLLPPPPVIERVPRRRGPHLEDGMTDQQLKFCDKVAEGVSLTEAYRTCYVTDYMKPATIYNKASQLFARNEIRERVERIREKKREGSLHDASRALDFALTRLQHEASNAEQPAARIRAVELIMKHHGLLSDTPRDTPDPHAGMDAASLRREIQERLLSALGPVVDDDTGYTELESSHNDNETDDVTEYELNVDETDDVTPET
jgi:hypothetical protein